MSIPSHDVMYYLRSLVHRQGDTTESDRELLRRFVEQRDDDAFAALLRRHGSMVLNLAQRITGDQQLAEDVFQAAFLLLSQKAATIRRPEALPCWLHGVARRLAVQARGSRWQRRRHEALALRASPPNPLDELTAQEFLAILDEELTRLPENYRAPLILCCLEGLPQEEAARRLGCSTGAIKGRLERGRQRLRLRLEKRGLTLPAVLGGTLLLGGATSPVPAALAQATLRMAAMKSNPAPVVAALIQKALQTMLVSKLQVMAAVVVLFALTGAGLGMMTLCPQAPGENTPPAADDKPLSAAKRVDLYGDPLPEGALRRLGTLQRRAIGAQIAATADGKSIVGVRAGRYISVWDADTGKLREKRELPSEFLGLSVLSPKGRWLATYANRQDRLAIWNMQTGTVARKLTVKGVHQFDPVVFSADGKRIAAVGHIGNESSLRVWDVDSGREIWQYHFATNFVCRNLALAPDGKRLLVTFDRMSCWDFVSGKRLWEKKVYCDSLVITADGHILSTMSQMPVLDLATGQPLSGIRLPRLDDGSISCLTLSPDERTLLLSSAKGVMVWNRDKREEVTTLKEAGELVVFLPDGKSIVTNNGSIQRWDLATGKPLWSDTFAQGHIGEVLGVSFRADGRHLISSSADGSLRLWDIASGRQRRLWLAHAPCQSASRRPASWDGVRQMDTPPDGRWILTADGGEEIKMWEATRDREVHLLRLPPAAKNEHYRTIIRLRLSPDGARAVALFSSTSFETRQPFLKWLTYKLASWDTKTGELLSCHVIRVKENRSSAIAPDGRTLLVDGRFMDVASGREIGHLQNPVLAHAFNPPPETPYVFSADGALLLSSFLDVDHKKGKSHGGARLWEAATGKIIGEAVVSPFGQVAFHPDPRFLVTNDRQGVRVWEASSGKIVASRKMPEQVWSSESWYRYAGCFAVSRDGKRLATGMPDDTILLWDITLPPSKSQRLQAKEIESLWGDLADADAAKAWHAVWRLANAPQDALAFLHGRVKPYPTAPAEQTRKLLADLDSDSFQVREEAVKRLNELGLQAEPALRAALAAKPTREQLRRIKDLLAALQKPSPLTTEELRQLRALIVLERIGTPEARRLLEQVAKGPESARLTRQARTALMCLR